MRLHAYTSLPSGVTGEKQVVFSLREVIPTGHKRTVRQVAWAPSGDIMATASFDCTVGIWERTPPEVRRDDPNEPEWDCSGTLEGHDSECKSVAFSHNGSLLASCSRDKSVWIWEVQPDSEFECLSVMMEHTQDVKMVAWHPKEEILASASYDDTIKLYVDDPSEDWFCYSTLNGHSSTVWSMAFSPCGRFLASASDDNTVRIWRRFTAQECEANGLAPEGKIPGRAGDKWVEVQCIDGHFSRTIYSLSWTIGEPEDTSQSYGKLAAAGADGKILVFYMGENAEKFKLSAALGASVENAHGVSDINCISWAPIPQKSEDDTTPQQAPTMLASAGDDGEIHIWT